MEGRCCAALAHIVSEWDMKGSIISYLFLAIQTSVRVLNFMY